MYCYLPTRANNRCDFSIFPRLFLSLPKSLILKYHEVAYDNTNKIACAPIEDSSLPVFPYLISILAVLSLAYNIALVLWIPENTLIRLRPYAGHICHVVIGFS